MIALDTNVLARLILNEDTDQVAKARQLIADNDIYIPKTVLLELSLVIGRNSTFDKDFIKFGKGAIPNVPYP
jgi:predicted nucleic-acid-binding protein